MQYAWTIFADDILKLFLALVIGGLIGAERELRDKAAGFRTMILICAGATLFTIFSTTLSTIGDPTRIAAGIVSGIGFLGAGVIMRERGQIKGVTTASTIWLVAALGMGIGAGYYLFSIIATIVVLLILLVFPYVEAWMGIVVETRTYQVIIPNDRVKYINLETLWRKIGLRIMSSRHAKRGKKMICTWSVSGSPKSHRRMIEILFANPDVKEFHL